MPALNFCDPNIWEQIIRQSQDLLFDPDYLIEYGNSFRKQYQRIEDVTWPEIDLDRCRFEQAGHIKEIYAGYDLPITFTPNDWNGKLVAVIAQDPLRKPFKGGPPSSFSIATPWGFSDPAAKMRKNNAKLWPAVEALCDAGYGVYLTDAAKLYFHPKNECKTKDTQKLEFETFKKEIKAVDPVHLVVFGNSARYQLEKMEIDDFDFHPHIAAYGNLKRHYKTDDETYPIIAEAIVNQIRDKGGVNIIFPQHLFP